MQRPVAKHPSWESWEVFEEDPVHCLCDTSQQCMAPPTAGSESQPLGSYPDSNNLVSLVMKMVDGINLLNHMLQEERF